MSEAEVKAADTRPVSAVSTAVGVSGLCGMVLAVIIARNFGHIGAALGFQGWPALADGPYSAIVALVFCGLPMVLWSLLVEKVHLRPSTGIDWSLKRPCRLRPAARLPCRRTVSASNP